MEKIEIYTSKKESILLLIFSLTLLPLVIWMVFDINSLDEWKLKSSSRMAIGLLAIPFFGLGIYVSIKRILKSQIALVVSSEGINLNPQNSLTEFVKWDDIIGFEEIKIRGTRVVIIKVKNPEYWLKKETSKFKRRVMKLNTALYNSPFNIGSAGLNIKAEELNFTLKRFFDKHKSDSLPLS